VSKQNSVITFGPPCNARLTTVSRDLGQWYDSPVRVSQAHLWNLGSSSVLQRINRTLSS